jgi:hypothetical protein
LPPPGEPIPAKEGVDVEVSAEPGATVEAGLFEVASSNLGSSAGTPQADVFGDPLSEAQVEADQTQGAPRPEAQLNARGRALSEGRTRWCPHRRRAYDGSGLGTRGPSHSAREPAPHAEMTLR